jgi:transcriptional repressor NrdR
VLKVKKNTIYCGKIDFEGIAKRRRECLKCSNRFNTKESVERPDIRVVKKDGSRQEFNSEKLRNGVLRACEKRPIETERIDKMLANVEAKILRRGGEIQSQDIGRLVSNELKKIDKVAYIRFASVYKDFEDVKDFQKEIKLVISK